MSKLSKEQQATWDRLNYVPRPFNRNGRRYNANYDINSMYPSSVEGIILGMKHVEADSDELKKFKVIKTRAGIGVEEIVCPGSTAIQIS